MIVFVSAWSSGAVGCCNVEKDSRENCCSVLALFSCSFLYASDIWPLMDRECWFIWRLDDLAWLFLSPVA